MVNHFLPGLRCLHADMEQLSPEHEVSKRTKTCTGIRVDRTSCAYQAADLRHSHAYATTLSHLHAYAPLRWAISLLLSIIPRVSCAITTLSLALYLCRRHTHTHNSTIFICVSGVSRDTFHVSFFPR